MSTATVSNPAPKPGTPTKLSTSSTRTAGAQFGRRVPSGCSVILEPGTRYMPHNHWPTKVRVPSGARFLPSTRIEVVKATQKHVYSVIERETGHHQAPDNPSKAAA